ncbi:hypothetical protein [Nocardioides ferulae]|uniref:hypothetical protein n=1 Tax=Nocardioides ferulae TaxID=2340821 RepID=UPI000EB1EC52|nr:hypothetical protein [Nocardioides ferulae]
MTERLSALLHDEADHLDVPPPAPGTVLGRGRALRRRRRVTTVAVAVASLAVVGVGSTLALGGDRDDDRAVEPAAPAAGFGEVFAIGTDIYLDGGRTHAVVDDVAVKSLYYTSAGVVVRHGNNSWSDGGGPQRFSLVAGDGTVTRLSVVTDGAVHATDPAQPYLAYAVRDGGGPAEVVVHDVTTDEVAARVRVPGLSGGWFPVAITGDTVFVGDGREDVFAVDWRTGEVTTSPVLRGYPEVAGASTSAHRDDRPVVLDVATGEVVLSPETTGWADLRLSPDGRYALLDQERDGGGGSSFQVYSVDTGESVEIEGETWQYGWTADGDLFSLLGRELTTCQADTGECATEEVDLVRSPAPGIDEGSNIVCDANGTCQDPEAEKGDSVDLKLGGRTYES